MRWIIFIDRDLRFWHNCILIHELTFSMQDADDDVVDVEDPTEDSEESDDETEETEA